MPVKRLRRRPRNYDAVADLVAEKVRSTSGRMSAKRLLPLAPAGGYAGSDRNFRRVVAEAKQAWRRDQVRAGGRRPAIWAPGEVLVIDWGEELVAGRKVHMFCVAWSRVRFVRFALDEQQATRRPQAPPDHRSSRGLTKINNNEDMSRIPDTAHIDCSGHLIGADFDLADRLKDRGLVVDELARQQRLAGIADQTHPVVSLADVYSSPTLGCWIFHPLASFWSLNSKSPRRSRAAIPPEPPQGRSRLSHTRLSRLSEQLADQGSGSLADAGAAVGRAAENANPVGRRVDRLLDPARAALRGILGS